MSPSHAARQLDAVRHAVLLGSSAALLAVARWLLAAPGIAPEFALYGAVHAASVAVSLKVQRPWPWQLLFVAAAALASETIARLGIIGLEPAVARWPAAGAAALLSGCAFIGALAYGVLIRTLLRYRLGWAALGAIALGCSVAAYGGLMVARRVPALGALWIALFWWCAFSAGLCHADSRRELE